MGGFDAGGDVTAFIAYMVECSSNGKRYIGITRQTLNGRWSGHVHDATKSPDRRNYRSALHNAMRKHGIDAFSIRVICEAASWRELVAIERGLIAQYGTMVPRGYNMTAGGEGRYGAKQPRAAVLITASKNRGRKLSDEHRLRLRIFH